MLSLWLLLFSGLFSVKGEQPNILVILADDLGWNDVSWNNPLIPTPNLEALRNQNAAILDQFYVNGLCTQSRSSFFTGNYPYKVGTQNGVFEGASPTGIPIKFPFFSEKLQTLGYKTYMTGKWHLGYCNSSYVPIGRGFDYFYGFYQGTQDYSTHRTGGPSSGYDMWNQIEANKISDETTVDFTVDGSYDTELFTDKAIQWLSSHPKDKPFFLYLAYNAPHSPLALVKKYGSNCGDEGDDDRKSYCTMVYAMDKGIGDVVQALKDKELYDNTIIIFSTDNGGNPSEGASNMPLRGRKGTVFEGGTRSPSFVHSAKYISKAGQRFGLMHMVDWYSTLLAMAGEQGSEATSYGDGLNQWAMISQNSTGERTVMVYNIADGAGAIRENYMKLVVGEVTRQSNTGWYPLPPEPSYGEVSLSSDSLLLFDLENDPNETTDLAKKQRYQGTLNALKEKFDEEKSKEVASVFMDEDEAGDPMNFGNIWASGWC